MQVHKATADELLAYIGIWGWIVTNGDDDTVVAVAGFRRDDRLWGFLDVLGQVPTLSLLRAMREKMEEVGEPIYVLQDDRFPSAPKLLRALGFAETGEQFRDTRIWKWIP